MMIRPLLTSPLIRTQVKRKLEKQERLGDILLFKIREPKRSSFTQTKVECRTGQANK
jgi:hypothetical protein